MRAMDNSPGRLTEYQRNTAWIGFITFVCLGAVCYMLDKVRLIIVPLIWSTFFALPLHGLIDSLERAFIRGATWVHRSVRRFRLRYSSGVEAAASRAKLAAGLGESNLAFESWSDSNEVLISEDEPLDELLQKVNTPCVGMCPCRAVKPLFGLCRRRVVVRNLQVADVDSVPPEIVEQVERSLPVDRLINNFAYYIVEPQSRNSGAAVGGRHLELFMDRGCHYPAVMGPAPGEPEQQAFKLRRTLELKKSSTISYGVAVVSSLAIVVLCASLFVAAMYAGVLDFQAHIENYEKGVLDFVAFARKKLARWVPKEKWDELQEQIAEFLQKAIPLLTGPLVGNLQHLIVQTILFIVYMIFWLAEPLPVNTEVAGVFKTYLIMKTCVCLLYAASMALLLYLLDCRLWFLFFVICFFLNYIPEVGAVFAWVMVFPAVLFDGNIPVERRIVNTLWLLIVGGFIKIATGHLLEVQIYSTRGGQFMRMHPVILITFIFSFSALLGVTGLFLSVPIMAVFKYYMLSSDMPGSILNPMLYFLEGDEAGPHKNYVDRRRRLERWHRGSRTSVLEPPTETNETQMMELPLLES